MLGCDIPPGLKPGGFSGLLPSHLPGVPRTAWRLPGYLQG